MKIREHIPASEWATARTVFEDEYGNRGEVRWPRVKSYDRLHSYRKWEDAEVHLNSHGEGNADEMGAYAEFALHLAHVAKTLDLAFAEDKAAAMEESERLEHDRQLRLRVREVALQGRCEDLAQYYMQMVRVQREGHSSHASGELNVTVINQDGGETTVIRRQMYLRERNGNRWTFNADQVSKFEVKDGNRYRKITLTPMAQLEAAAQNQVAEEVA